MKTKKTKLNIERFEVARFAQSNKIAGGGTTDGVETTIPKTGRFCKPK